MRSKEDIDDDYQQALVNTFDFPKDIRRTVVGMSLQLEVLLDIRELLQEVRDLHSTSAAPPMDGYWDKIEQELKIQDGIEPRVLTEEKKENEVPIDVILYCPNCKEQHIDRPETDEQYKLRQNIAFLNDKRLISIERWTNPPHRSHKCEFCGIVWRPSDSLTNGVSYAAIKTHGKADTWSGNWQHLTMTENEGYGVLSPTFTRVGAVDVLDMPTGSPTSTLEKPALLKPWHQNGRMSCQYCNNYSPAVHFPAHHRFRITSDSFNKGIEGCVPSRCGGMLHCEAQPAGPEVSYDFLVVVVCDLCEFIEGYPGFRAAECSDFINFNARQEKQERKT
jgi:hypothetical protein